MNSTPPAAATMPMSPNDRELVLTRLMHAPRELVFAAFTDPQQLRRWWGPKDYPATHVEMDVRVGGRWRNCLTATADGRELWQHGVFREVSPPSHLAFTFVWEEEGERGLETLVTITLVDEGGETRLTLRQTPFHSIAERDGHGGGWSSSFDRLNEFLAGAKLN
jgi:uncharacterized protein YndB with AHSA1/START domain